MSLTFLAPLSISAYSDEDVIYNQSYFNDEEVPMIGGDTSLLVDVNGYQVNSYYREFGTDAFLAYESNNSSFSSNPNTYYDIKFEIKLPKAITQGTYFNINIPINIGGVSSYGYPTFQFVRGNQIQSFENTPYYEYRDTGAYTLEFYTTDPIEATNEFDKIIILLQSVKVTGSKTYIYINSININESNNTQALINAIMPILQAIDTRLMAINSNISTTVSSVRIAIEELHSLVATTVNNNIINIRTSIENLNKQLTATINVLSSNIDTWIKTQTTSLSNKLDDVKNAILGNGNTINNKEELDNTVDGFNEGKDMLDELEFGITDSLSYVTEISPPTNGLSHNFNFVKTAQFISNELSYIYNSHNDYMAFINILMIIGIAFLILGISVKR